MKPENTIPIKQLSPYEQAINIIFQVSNEHGKKKQLRYPATLRQEEKALRLLDQAIEEGMLEAYPLKALLAASNNWHTGLILRIGQFQQILLEGIDKGCLAPENTTAWEWMEVAASNNNPTEFMTDIDRYYELLAYAVEHGNAIAFDLMNAIWEPEQIIEED